MLTGSRYLEKMLRPNSRAEGLEPSRALRPNGFSAPLLSSGWFGVWTIRAAVVDLSRLRAISRREQQRESSGCRLRPLFNPPADDEGLLPNGRPQYTR